MDGLPITGKEEYLSEGISIRFDGYQLWLSSNRYDKDEVALNSQAFQKMIEWIDQYSKLREYLYGVKDVL